MEEQRRLFRTFLSVHAHKACPTPSPVAHLQFYRGQEAGLLLPSDDLLAFDQEDVLSALDTESELVRFLLHQMATYDCTTQRIVGLIFDERTVLSEVLRMPE